MIRSLADKETEKIYHQEFSRKLPQSIQRIALRKLMMIDNAEKLDDLRIPPANRLEALKGDRQGGPEMGTYIETPKISEILLEEFMEPMNISAYKLANDIHVPVSRIQDILHDRRKVTVDTSIRLGIYFGVSEKYFLNLQNDIDIRQIEEDEKKSIAMIVPFKLGFAYEANKN